MSKALRRNMNDLPHKWERVKAEHTTYAVPAFASTILSEEVDLTYHQLREYYKIVIFPEAFPLEHDFPKTSDISIKPGIGEEQAKFIMVNSTRVTEIDYELHPRHKEVIFLPMGGG